MKSRLIVLGAILLMGPLAVAQSLVSSAEDQVVQAEREWLRAESQADFATLQRLIAADFIGTSPGATLLTKDDVIPANGDTVGRMPKSSLKDWTVRIYGDTAVLIGSLSADNQQGSSIRVTSVFQKRSEGWQMIAAHLSH